jgi:hypothetical protein
MAWASGKDRRTTGDVQGCAGDPASMAGHYLPKPRGSASPPFGGYALSSYRDHLWCPPSSASQWCLHSIHTVHDRWAVILITNGMSGWGAGHGQDPRRCSHTCTSGLAGDGELTLHRIPGTSNTNPREGEREVLAAIAELPRSRGPVKGGRAGVTDHGASWLPGSRGGSCYPPRRVVARSG